MPTPEIRETRVMYALAREFIRGTQLETSKRYADAPHFTLMMEFAHASTDLTANDMKKTFPRMTRVLAEEHHNDPTGFDWFGLAIAIDHCNGRGVWNADRVK